MISNCVQPDYERFAHYSQFEGVIRTTVNTKQKLYFVVPKGDYKILKKIEKCKPKNQLDQLPKPGTWSLFHHEARNKFYRAFVLSTNRGDDARALFLYDTGEVLYGQFKKEQFFFVPDHIDHFSAFALFVKIEVPFNPDASIPPVKLEAMRECFLKFTVLKNTQFSKEKMIFNIESRCVVLRLNDADRPKSDSDDDDSSDASATVRNMYSQKRAMFTLDDLPKRDTGNIKAGSIVLVYPSKFRADDKSIYVNIASIVDCSDLCLFKKIIRAGFALRIWLNKTLVCQFIRTLDESPKTNEMVIALVDESRYYERAVVQRVHSDGKNAEVFFIDLGCTQQVNINEVFKFPVKCSTRPPERVHLTVTNLNQQNTKALNPLPSILMAQVESTTFVSSQLHVSAKLYDVMGQSLF